MQLTGRQVTRTRRLFSIVSAFSVAISTSHQPGSWQCSEAIPPWPADQSSQVCLRADPAVRLLSCFLLASREGTCIDLGALRYSLTCLVPRVDCNGSVFDLP